jgi:hypothetical protein
MSGSGYPNAMSITHCHCHPLPQPPTTYYAYIHDVLDANLGIWAGETAIRKRHFDMQ